MMKMREEKIEDKEQVSYVKHKGYDVLYVHESIHISHFLIISLSS